MSGRTSVFATFLGLPIFAAQADADSRPPLPMAAIDGQVGIDSASSDGSRSYTPTTAVGLGIRAQLSIAGLLKGPRAGSGFFVRDHFMAEFLVGGGGEGIHGRAFGGAGLRIGTQSQSAAYYVAARAFTGFDTARNEVGAGTGAGRAAWLLGVGAAFLGGSFEVGAGNGWDTAGSEHTAFDLDISKRLGSSSFAVGFVHYQGLFGDAAITEHSLSAGIGMRI